MRRLLALVFVTGLTACGSASPTPASFPLVVTQPYFEPLVVAWSVAYRATLPGPLPFELDTRTRSASIEAVEQGEAALVVTSGEPPVGWFATPVGRVGLAVVVHSDNPVRDLTMEELNDLFAGRAATWSAVGGREVPVQPVLPVPGEPAGEAFRQAVLRDSAPWPGTLLAPTAAAMVELVARDEGAIGILPTSAVTEDLRSVRIEGVLPGAATIADGSYPLTIALFAAAPREPGSPLREFLVWIQSSRDS